MTSEQANEGRGARLAVTLSGTNLARASDYNQRVILQAIRINGETSRAELSRTTGLTAPTIANITRRLMDAGLVKEVGRLQGPRGQPAIRLKVEPLGCIAIGLNIDRDHLTLLALDLAGDVCARRVRDVAFALPDDVVRFVREALDSLLAEVGVGRDRVLGMGVAIPDDLGEITLPGRPAQYDLWANLSIPELLAPIVPWPILVDNDAAAAAIGEAHSGTGLTLPSFFYILISSGLGGGLMIDRHYVEGANRRSAELGLLPDVTSATPGAVVQDVVSLSALAQYLAKAGIACNEPADLCFADAEVKAVVDRWLDDATRALTPPLVNVNGLIDPHAIILGGRLPGELMEALIARLQQALASMRLPTNAPIYRAKMAQDGPAIGAAILPFLDRLLPSDATLMQAGRSS
ncbi:Sugar kinase of the NBD/HSP70 family, may contain an N-terminal HTH domain [Sphingomonas gellani]|uniref:Sugar kinase of the NBD/HSP70 family, may contain an N-terminal HTH domain n=1 Tax=Sphingomonas gellani TaxID=1166340 RepID=A0A1H8AZS2_9SPHN|nr:ROK family transcriptional regulator [Sphingomonas gellani]SEM76003.1 Sugar kinase of the NBD/HSP70 family, may contain an N-terminal HTH domain [Sphingomonas gellani]